MSAVLHQSGLFVAMDHLVVFGSPLWRLIRQI